MTFLLPLLLASPVSLNIYTAESSLAHGSNALFFSHLAPSVFLWHPAQSGSLLLRSYPSVHVSLCLSMEPISPLAVGCGLATQSTTNWPNLITALLWCCSARVYYNDYSKEVSLIMLVLAGIGGGLGAPVRMLKSTLSTLLSGHALGRPRTTWVWTCLLQIYHIWCCSTCLVCCSLSQLLCIWVNGVVYLVCSKCALLYLLTWWCIKCVCMASVLSCAGFWSITCCCVTVSGPPAVLLL